MVKITIFLVLQTCKIFAKFEVCDDSHVILNQKNKNKIQENQKTSFFLVKLGGINAILPFYRFCSYSRNVQFFDFKFW